LNVDVLKAVVRTDAELEFFDCAVEQRGCLTDGILRRDGAVAPDLDGQLVVVGVLAETGCFDGVVDFANGRVDGVDRDVADRQILWTGAFIPLKGARECGQSDYAERLGIMATA
jgi:hypothetical protein